AAATELDDLGHDAVGLALPGPLAVGPPDGAEGAVLRAAADRLHRAPHVLARLQQVPSGRAELLGLDAAPLVHGLKRAARAVAKRGGPGAFAVPLDDGVRRPEIARLLGVERRMDPAVDDRRAGMAREPADLIAAQHVARMDA